MLKKLTFMAAMMGACSFAHANVIGLSPFNADICRQTLTHAVPYDKHPVVFMYIKGCPWAEKLMPLFQQVSNEHPDRAFFAFEYAGGGHDYLSAKTALGCFGVMPLYSPTVWMFDVETQSDLATPGNIKGIVKVGLNGGSTKQEIIDFIGQSASLSMSSLS